VKGTPQVVQRDLLSPTLEQEQIGHDCYRSLHMIGCFGDLTLPYSHDPLLPLHNKPLADDSDTPCAGLEPVNSMCPPVNSGPFNIVSLKSPKRSEKSCPDLA
jgi:hypothetical protein